MEEQLTEPLKRIKLLEQEHGTPKTLAKEEEVARIAAEVPLLESDTVYDDDFSTPKKKTSLSL